MERKRNARKPPVRNLFYVSDLYSVLTKECNLYGEILLKLPTPQFIVFYNGVEEQPAQKELKLSDAFELKEQEVNLELKVLVLNINPGKNDELLSKCRTLKDYMQYVEKVRTYAKQMPLSEAMELAVDECIQDDILADFLKNYKAEAMSMSIYEYDEEKHMQQVFAEGEAKGEEMFAALTRKLLADHREQELSEAVQDKELRRKLYCEYGIANEGKKPI